MFPSKVTHATNELEHTHAAAAQQKYAVWWGETDDRLRQKQLAAA